MTHTVFFYCNAVDGDIRAERNITTDSPAATRKVFGIARALRVAGCDVTVISMGRGRVPGQFAFYRGKTVEKNGVAVRYGPFATTRGLSELLSMVWLLWMAIRLSWGQANARHLFYNQFSAYLPALAWLRLRRRQTVGDIEDGPIDARVQSTLRTRANADPALFARFISHGALIACRALANGTTIRPTLPCYGALRLAEAPSPRPTYPIVVLMSGWINDGTGGDLLLAALRRLADADDPRLLRLSIEVSGFGDGLDALAQAARDDPRLRLVVHGRLDNTAYGALLNRAAVGLSLKTHAGAYADTTFPSKVMEYAERGLCIVSTDISDVRHVFGDAIRYVTGDDPAQVAAHLEWIADYPDEVNALGRAGRALVAERFTEEAVGRTLSAFMFGDKAA